MSFQQLISSHWSLPIPGWDRHGPAVKVAAAAVLATTASAYAIHRTRRWWTLREKRKHKLESHKRTLEGLERHLHEFNISQEMQQEICGLSMRELRDRLHRGELEAVDVMHAYQKRALEENKTVNAITEIVYEAEAEAVQCDMTKDKSRRLLHGIPISIKECIPMEGYDCVIGFVDQIDKPAEEDSVVVKVLKHQGAIPFMRTNVPQTMLSFDTCNPIFGQTLNPRDTKRTSGGSSGGESALLASGGSIIGIGGDIGGSIRIPASFCGIYGFKPTAGRFSKCGSHSLFQGQNMITSSYGPMGRDVDSLVLIMQALLCPYHFELDKSIPPLPFRDEIYEGKKKIRIGYYLDDGYVASTPHMKRGVLIAVEALRSAGYEVVTWEFPDMGPRSTALWSKCMFADGGKELFDYLQDDVTDHAFMVGSILFKIAKWRALHSAICKLLEFVYPLLLPPVRAVAGMKSVVEWQQCVRAVDAFRQEVQADLSKKNVDVIIAPGFAMPACPVGSHRFATGAACTTAVFNTLNFPAGSLPVTVANDTDTRDMADYPTSDPWHKAIKKMCVGAEGLPINVQVAALPWQDETCLRVMKDLETALKQQ